MSINKLKRIAFFSLYTYCIANSILVGIWIPFFYNEDYGYNWENFKIFFCQWNIIEPFFHIITYHIFLLLQLLIFCYEALILYYPVRLWWRKKTIFHAWLVACAGMLLPNYLYKFVFKKEGYDVMIPSFLVMTSLYIATGMISYGIRQFRTIACLTPNNESK